MKSVLISIRPQWVEKIASGEKTIEVRKNAPKEVPFKCYIYETKGQYVKFTHGAHTKYGYGRGKVIGEFICDRIEMVNAKCSDYGIDLFYHDCLTNGCLTEREIEKYFNIPEDRDLRAMKGSGYVWHISDLKIYDKPKELSDFLKPCPDTFHYCTICKHCVKIIPPDEEEYALYHGGQYDYWEEHCTNRLTSPPQSWMYIEGLREG